MTPAQVKELLAAAAATTSNAKMVVKLVSRDGVCTVDAWQKGHQFRFVFPANAVTDAPGLLLRVASDPDLPEFGPAEAAALMSGILDIAKECASAADEKGGAT